MHDAFPLPEVDWPPAAELWAGAARGELRIPRCGSCRRYQWYPSESCSRCGWEDMPWVTTSGRGSLFSWVVVNHAFLPQFADKVPFVPALVSLLEDPSVRLVTQIVDADADALEFGQALEVTFRLLAFTGVPGEVVAPFFRPATGPAGLPERP